MIMFITNIVNFLISLGMPKVLAYESLLIVFCVIASTPVLAIGIKEEINIFLRKREKAKREKEKEKNRKTREAETRIQAAKITAAYEIRQRFEKLEELHKKNEFLISLLQDQARWSQQRIEAAEKAEKEAARKKEQTALKNTIRTRIHKGFRPLGILKTAEKEINLRKENKIGVYDDVDSYFEEAAEVASKGEHRSFLYFPSNRRKINGVKWNHYYLPTWASKAVAEEWKKLYCH